MKNGEQLRDVGPLASRRMLTPAHKPVHTTGKNFYDVMNEMV